MSDGEGHNGPGTDEGAVERDWATGLDSGRGARLWVEHRRESGTEGPTLLLLGLSAFRKVNVSHGREAGDAALRTVGERLQRMMREDEQDDPFVARTGGAEFLIGLDGDIGEGRSQLLAHRLVSGLNTPVAVGGGEVYLGPRIGMAAARTDEPAAKLMRRARLALADAMESDTRAIVASEAGAVDEALLDDEIERDLRLALDRDEIEIRFQPQFAVAGGAMSGAEALARWQHPKFGAMGGEALFAAAAGSDFVLPLSRHIQRRALEAAAEWPKAVDHLRLSINVTAQDAASPDCFDRLMQAVEQSGFPTDRVTVEITESGLIANLDGARALFERLRAKGIRVALDDFGTGYSSLAYLSALPLDYLKIDKGLTGDLHGSDRDRIVVRAVIAMAKALGLEVIAEGIETEAQLRLIADEQCDFYQGFLKSESLDAKAFAAFALRAD